MNDHTQRGDEVRAYGPRSEQPRATVRDFGDWSRRYLEHAPFAVAVVSGEAHTVVHANAAFRRLTRSQAAGVGRPVTEGLTGGTARELAALLDRVRRQGVIAREEIDPLAQDSEISWAFTVWPVLDGDSNVDQLVIMLLEAPERDNADRAPSQQTEIAERLLLSALREQMLAEEAEASRRRAAFLAEASVRVGASLDTETTYASIAGLALPRPGSWSIVDIVESDGVLRRLAILHPDPACQEVARGLEQVWHPEAGDAFGVPRVIRSPRPVARREDIEGALATTAHGPDTLHALRELGIGPLLVVPLLIRGTVGGAITFVSPPGGSPYSAEEVSLAKDLASACAAAIESARLYEAAVVARAAAEAAQRDAEAANLAKSRFLSMMTHDLRTPLNAIGGYAQLLDMGIRGPVTEAQHRDLKRIKASQEHLLGLINKILSFAKLEAGRAHYEMTDVPLHASIREVEAFISPQLLQRRLDYRYEPPAGSERRKVRVRADPEKLMQILINLLTNAIKFTEPRGSITVSFDLPGDDMASIRVRDTGRGVPSDELESIFEPFVQGRGLPTPAEGVGLGLAICRELARGMGGDLAAESTLGEGSVFTLTLRRSRAEAQRRSRAAR